MRLSYVFVALSLLMLAPFARADEDHPCLADAQKLCGEVEPGKGRIAKCLKAHEGEISAACKEKRADFKEHRMERRAARHEEAGKMREACKDDMARLCADVKPGGGRIMKCMKAHEDEFSAECKAARDAAKARHGK